MRGYIMYKLFQISVPREQYDEVNKLGWSEAMVKYPLIEASQALRMAGSEAYVTEYDALFTHVADLDADNLEEAFRLHNFQEEDKITRYAKQHSLSVGDICVGEYGDVHICDNFGWTQMMSSNLGNMEKAA